MHVRREVEREKPTVEELIKKVKKSVKRNRREYEQQEDPGIEDKDVRDYNSKLVEESDEPRKEDDQQKGL